jgi:hypothetical protein
MPYKRPVHNFKKYASPFYSPNPPYTMNSSAVFQDKDIIGIPLPNEKEAFPENPSEKRKASSLAGVVNYLRRHVKIEDLILIGLIVLMLDESVEDDLLLIVLIYILLF